MSSQWAEMDSDSVAMCSDLAELDSSPPGLGSGVSRTLVRQAHVQTIAQPERSHGPLLGYYHPRLLTGTTGSVFAPLCSWLHMLHGLSQSTVVPNPCSPGHAYHRPLLQSPRASPCLVPRDMSWQGHSGCPGILSPPS